MTLYKATPEQIIEGDELTYGDGCTITCASTGETLREGDEVMVHVDRHNGSEAWHMVGVYSGDAIRGCDLHQKNEFDEILAVGRLAVASDRETKKSRLILRDVEIANHRKIGE